MKSGEEPTPSEPIIIPIEGSDLAHDFQGKTNINLDDLEPTIYYKVLTGSGNINYNSGDKSAYYEGVFSGSKNTTNANYTYIVSTFNSSQYSGQSYCFTGYTPNGQRLFHPQCGIISIVGDGITMNFEIPQEIIFFGYLGDSIENATKFFLLPPFHVGVWP